MGEKKEIWSEYKVLVQETMLDFMGHMNNATYLTLFEEARWDSVTRNGYGYDKIQETKKGPVILEVQLKYLKELRLREEIIITTELLEYPGRVGKLRQRMLKSNGEIASEAIFAFGLFDMQLRTLIPPTAEWKLAVGLS